MDDIKEAVEDLIEETCLRTLNDHQLEQRIQKFTEICIDEISARIADSHQRQFLIERLQIMKCFYNRSSAHSIYSASAVKTTSDKNRNKRLQNIVKKRRLALQMIQRTDPELAQSIQERLERSSSSVKRQADLAQNLERLYLPLSLHHWYFLYFNIFLLICLIVTVIMVVK